MRSHFLMVCAALAFMPALARLASAQPMPYVWLEGEEPAFANIKPNAAGWGRKEFLSQEKWLHVSIDTEKVEDELPREGALLRYEFELPRAGAWEIWNRIGFEFVRSPFEWRIDEGAWSTVSPDELTTDLMEISEWCEVAWLKLGEANLPGGRHVLTIRLPLRHDSSGKPERVLYASDALCLTLGRFHPRGRLKPDDDGRTPRDEEAARQVFELPAPPKAGARSSIALKGLWEVCRADEQLPAPDVAVPMEGLPEQPYWTAIPVPGDKNRLRPDLIFCHRLWYRTRVRVPEECAGRSFFLVFPQNNLNTTVVVNGVPCGFFKNPFARFEIDISRAIRPGVNEILVGIRDAWYAYSTNPKDPMKLRRKFNLPVRFFEEGFQDLSYPVWNHAESGILFTPELVSAGSAYTTDTFVQPSVARKELVVETDVAAPPGSDFAGTVLCEAVDPSTGKVEHRLSPTPVTVRAGERVRLKIRGPWANPRLWWPDDPHLYHLRLSLQRDDAPVDVAETPFGFREWTIDGSMFRLNGVVWRLWADLKEGATPEEWLANYRRTNQRMQRFWGMSWMGMSPNEALDFFDRNGVVIRRSGLLDGQRIGYHAMENDPDLRALYGSEIKMDLMRNWRDQVVAQVKGERNHPSILIWSLENEWLYINCINLHASHMDEFEREVQVVADAVREADPTRPVMVDGGGATKAQTLPVHGDHYVFDPSDTRYPDLAYEANPKGGGRGRWEWDGKRPRFLGEDYFANGINPFDYGYFGGEAAFQGKAQARPAAGVIARMLNEGYRWAGYAAWHFWMGEEEAVNQYASNAPRAVLCREWNWTFAPGQAVRRTFRVYNDTRLPDRITFVWRLTVAGKETASERAQLRIPPGEFQEIRKEIRMPTLAPGQGRQEGALELTLVVNGTTVFRDVKRLFLLPQASLSKAVISLTPAQLLVYDPGGTAVRYLQSRGIRFTPLQSLNTLPASGRILIVGRDALDEATSGSSRLAAWASAGRRVVVLDQRHPLRYQGLPVRMEATSHEGRTAYLEDASHALCRGLRSEDFWTWGVNIPVYRNAYGKPSQGARSLIQCHSRLSDTALVEAPVGEGVMILCQLAIGSNLAGNAVARRVFDNMLERAATYRRVQRTVTVCPGEDARFREALDRTGLRYAPASDAVAALSGSPAQRLAVVEATPAHLKRLASSLEKVKAYCEAGGWLLLHGLTPEGLADFNKLVGFPHMIRPFRMERVTLPPSRSPLAAGLTLTDVVLYSGERIFGWTSDEYLASDMFTYCVDYRDVAPFARMPSDYHYNIVNGMYSADAWKYIFYFHLDEVQPEFVMELPQEQTIERVDWAGNAHYHLVTRISLSSETGQTVTLDVKPGDEEQSFELKEPLKGRRITLRIVDWQKVSRIANVVGIDNLRLYVRRPADFLQRVRPIVDPGAIMEYRIGRGGIVLCNLLFKERETVSVNAKKKLRILSTILANLDAPLGTGTGVIAGAELAYRPLDISSRANQYRNERGWFGDPALTLAALPSGRNVFGGVPFIVHDFPTSPVPTVIMLGGPGVPGNLPDAVRDIPVGGTAHALFFLHTARVDQPLSEQERRQRKRAEFCRYVIRYADGSSVEVPVYLDEDIADYRQKEPAALPGAQLGWARPYEGRELQAAVYVFQWNNPRPDVPIASLDLVCGSERRGVPALIAVTAASLPRKP